MIQRVCATGSPMRPANLTDYSGQVFGRLTAIRRVPRDKERPGVRWLFRCSCGEEVVHRISKVLTGNTSSCGCLKKTQGSYSQTKHAHWRRWLGMVERCHLPSNDKFHLYGARGIKVCERWRSFPNFIEDMESSYFDGATIERVNNDGDYEPSNCKWADSKEQGRNKRNNMIIEHNGERLTLSTWAERSGMSRVLISRRIRTGWNTALALTTPPLPRGVERRGGARR